MALINLSVNQLERIESNISGLDNDLLNQTLPRIESAINSISEDIQGSELQPLVKKINLQYETIKSGLSKGFTTLEEFLKNQLKSYRLTEEQAQQELVQTLKKMLSLTGIDGKILASKYDENGKVIGNSYFTEGKSMPKNISIAEKRTLEDAFWNDIKENWSGIKNNDGLFGKAGALIDGTIRTGNDLADGVMNIAGDVVNKVWDTAGKVSNGVTDALGNGIKNIGDGTFAEPVTNFVGSGVDKIGDGAEWIGDKAGDFGNGIAEAPGNFMEWMGVK